MGGVAAQGPRREPCSVTRAIKDEVAIRDRQPGTVRAIGVDTPGLELPIPLADDRDPDDDLPAVVRPVRLPPLSGDPPTRCLARERNVA